MIKSHQTASGEAALLYSNDNLLFFQTAGPKNVTRPTLLSTHYQGCLDSVISGDNLYYSFVDQADRLNIFRIGDQDPLLSFSQDHAQLPNASPRLLLFREELLLFHPSAADDSFCLQITFPLNRTLDHLTDIRLNPDSCFTILQSDSKLFLLFEGPDGSDLYRMNNDFQLISHPGKDKKADDRLLQLQQADHQLILEKDEELFELRVQLERAKLQYQELMFVAEQYRDEAAKWYNRVIHR